jgi:hypothetical protein
VAPPVLGEQTFSILREILGMSAGEVADLETRNIVRSSIAP